MLKNSIFKNMQGMIKLENLLFACPIALTDSGHINQWMKTLCKRLVENFIMEDLGYPDT